MSISPEVKLAVDEIHRERNALAAAAKANELQAAQIADLGAQISALKVGTTLSEDDKKALLDAVNDVGETNSELAAAVPANVDVSAVPAPQAQPVPPPNDPDAPRPDPIPGTGQNGAVPLMPNSAFDPGAGSAAGPTDPGQPAQAAAIPTAGGFVVSGGGVVQRDTADVHPMSAAGVAANPAPEGTSPTASEPSDPETLAGLQGSVKGLPDDGTNPNASPAS